ncbi:MAG: HAMP domain-containing protein [Planctomycetia bacterium]|nr:HAMP domain-containing protein [Planctomycetia bacterium]
MSYRSFKRVLGETHLEIKCLVLFGFCALLLTLASFYFYGWQTNKLVYGQNQNIARRVVNQVFTEIHWKRFETAGGKELADEISKDVKPLIVALEELDASQQERNRAQAGGDAAALARLDDEIARHEEKIQELRRTDRYLEWRSIRPHATEKAYQARDEDEHEILTGFLRNPPPAGDDHFEFAERSLPDNQEYHYYQAFRAKSSCVLCHRAVTGPDNLKEGDLIAVLKVRMADDQSDIQWNNAILWATAIIAAFLLVVASYLIIRYVIAKPLKHLQEVSDQISKGDLEKRAEIHTGDEFEDLAAAFNRMVRHLIEAQDELKHVNIDLDGKVDELAQRNMQLYEMNRLKSDFLATMSHELRTPLNSIIGFSDVLASIDSLDEKQRRYVLNIQKSGKVLLEMINDILDLAKIESGKTDLRLSDFRIEQVVHAQCDMARPLTEKKNIDLIVDVPPGLEEMHQDQGKVQQILNNLLSNAFKFTPEGGTITVQVRRDAAGWLHLIISDTGVGIAEEDQVRIFEKFRQGSAAVPGGDATTREHSGTGLGLSIVKELCKLLGGEIALASELGRGSTFRVRLPWRLEEKASPEDVFLPLPTLAAGQQNGAPQPAGARAESVRE